MTSFVALLLLALAPSAFTLDFEVYIPLQKVDLFERLGLNNVSTAQGALEDGRLDAIMALGGDMYTAQLGVGTPQQPLDFVLNFMGGQISPNVGDLPLVIGTAGLDNKTMFNGENRATVAFNSSASCTFKPRPDIHFHTVINPFPLSFNAAGSIVEENIQLPYTNNDTTEEQKIILRERMLGHVEHIGGEVFGKLQIGGILSVGSQSSIAQKLASRFDASLSMVLILSKKKAELRLRRYVTGIRSDFPCRNVNFRINLLDKVENQTDSLIDNLDTYKFQMTGVGLAIPPYMAYEDKEERIAVVNPNSMFIQGPQKTVQIWAKMANAVQMPIGRQQLYVINCNEQFGPLTFKIAKWNHYSLPKDLLQIELPSNLLPKNKCLWAIQEGTEGQDFWLIGRPFFKQYCLAIDLPTGKIDFPEIKPVENDESKSGKWLQI